MPAVYVYDENKCRECTRMTENRQWRPDATEKWLIPRLIQKYGGKNG
jgi:hypothetical protein